MLGMNSLQYSLVDDRMGWAARDPKRAEQ